MAELDLPRSMGCIVRTAGLQRTKTEIRRDFDYLARVWDGIRETTLNSSAPALIHNDSDLIKRAIRDIYNKDIDEVIVEGEEGYRAAREYMKLLMPSHAKRVQPYADVVPLYQRHHVEDQLNAMYQPIVQLKSGGYLVINPTEALVSIDINSGRSTREHGIEATAVGTNLEAAQEIARQLRLRDMAGLVVIDFIDMEHGNNVRKVEKAMKAALANDRARIQVGRISSFGLMEMSRQRLRTGVLEASTRQCPHCEGTGLVRTASSAALSALRLLEEEAARGAGSRLSLRASQEATIYVLNRKRAELADIEERYGVSIDIFPDGETEGARMMVEASGPAPAFRPKVEPLVIEDDDDLDIVDEIEDDEEDAAETETRGRDSQDGDARRKRSRRRRGRRGRREEGEGRTEADGTASIDEPAEVQPPHEAGPEESEEEGARRRSRRGRRGGRGRRGDRPETTGDGDEASEAASPEPAIESVAIDVVAEETAKKPRRRSAKAKVEIEAPVETAPIVEAELPVDKPKRSRKNVDTVAEAAAAPATVVEAEAPKPKRARKAKAEAEPVAADADGGLEDDGTPRRGWWQRTFGPES